MTAPTPISLNSVSPSSIGARLRVAPAVDNGHHLRRRVGDRLQCTVTHDHELAGVQIYTDAVTSSSNPIALPLTADDGCFQVDIPLREQGHYHFRFLYSLDGRHWFWDRRRPTPLIVLGAERSPVRMYTLIPTVSGTISQWTAMLPHIRQLGCDTVHLLPITTMDSSESPYAAADLFSVDPRYADATIKTSANDQFQTFVDRARAHDLRLCLDLVYNHVGVGSSLATTRPDWIIPDADETDGMMRAGWSDGHNWYKWQDLVRIDFDHPFSAIRKQIWDYMFSYVRFWAKIAANTDGMVRLDNLHSSHSGFTRYALHELRREFPDLRVLGELFTHATEKTRLTWEFGLDLLLATPWEHPFVPRLRTYIAELHNHGSHIPHMVPLTSHDSGSPAEEFGTPAATCPRYALSALCGTGATGITQDTEFGIAERHDFIGIKPPTPITSNYNYVPFISAVNELLATWPVFQRIGNLRFVDNNHDAIIGGWRYDPSGEQDEFVVIANFDTYGPQQCCVCLESITPAQAERCRDALTDIPVPITVNELDLPLTACEVRILRLPPRNA